MPKAAATQPGLVDRIAHDIQSGVWRRRLAETDRSAGALRLHAPGSAPGAGPAHGQAPDRAHPEPGLSRVRHGSGRARADPRHPHPARDRRGGRPDAQRHQRQRALRALAERFAKLLQDGTLLEQYEVNLAFHAALYDLCSNRELVALIQETRARPAAPAKEWVRARIEIRARAFRHGRRARGARRQAPAEDHRGARGPGHFLSAAANRGSFPDPAGWPRPARGGHPATDRRRGAFGRPSCAPGRRASGILPMAS